MVPSRPSSANARLPPNLIAFRLDAVVSKLDRLTEHQGKLLDSVSEINKRMSAIETGSLSASFCGTPSMVASDADLYSLNHPHQQLHQQQQQLVHAGGGGGAGVPLFLAAASVAAAARGGGGVGDGGDGGGRVARPSSSQPEPGSHRSFPAGA